MSQHSEIILQIIAAVDSIDAHDHAKYSLKKFINETCLAAGITIVDRQERVQYARRLLDDGEPRPLIRERLISRYGIKRASAYAAIDKALKLSSGHEKSWTKSAQTGFTGSTNSPNSRNADEPLPK